MLGYIIRRVLLMIPTLLIISIISFIIIQLPPGDFLTVYIARLEAEGAFVDEGEEEALRRYYGIDGTVFEQYMRSFRAVIDPERTWSVPVTAAQVDENGGSYVWKIDPSAMTVSRTAVELGDLLDERVMIRSGVSEGDMLAVSGVTQLREGMQIRPYER